MRSIRDSADVVPAGEVIDARGELELVQGFQGADAVDGADEVVLLIVFMRLVVASFSCTV